MNMLPVTYGYARVSKSDDDAKNLDTQLRLLAHHGIREDLMGPVQPGDTIVVAFLDRFSRNFEEGVRIQAELTARDIGNAVLLELHVAPPKLRGLRAPEQTISQH